MPRIVKRRLKYKTNKNKKKVAEQVESYVVHRKTDGSVGYIDSIMLGDCLDILYKIKNQSIDLVLTSPPYYKQREYGGIGIGNEKTEDEYIENLVNVFIECVRVTKDSGAIVFNLGDKYIEGTLSLLPYKFAIKAIEATNVNLINNLTWLKFNPTPRQDEKKLVQATEPFFIFTKSRSYKFNKNDFLKHYDLLRKKSKTSNGVGKSYFELIEKSNLSKSEKEKAIIELQKVILQVQKGEIESFRMKIRGLHSMPYGGQEGGRKIQIDRNGFTIIKILGNNLKRDVIESPVETIKNNKHPAVFPLFVIQEIIKLLSSIGDVVLDPFVGSGTTCLAARILKRHYVGIEINKMYVDFAKQRINSELLYQQEELFL